MPTGWPARQLSFKTDALCSASDEKPVPRGRGASHNPTCYWTHRLSQHVSRSEGLQAETLRDLSSRTATVPATRPAAWAGAGPQRRLARRTRCTTPPPPLLPPPAPPRQVSRNRNAFLPALPAGITGPRDARGHLVASQEGEDSRKPPQAPVHGDEEEEAAAALQRDLQQLDRRRVVVHPVVESPLL